MYCISMYKTIWCLLLQLLSIKNCSFIDRNCGRILWVELSTEWHYVIPSADQAGVQPSDCLPNTTSSWKSLLSRRQILSFTRFNCALISLNVMYFNVIVTRGNMSIDQPILTYLLTCLLIYLLTYLYHDALWFFSLK